jgi:hypothetical protein
MTNKEILTRVNTLLKRAFVKLEQQTLENGTIIEAETFAAGSPVFIVTEDQKLPLPIGEYILADGSVLEVTEEGIIGEIATSSTETAEGEVSMADEVVETTPVASEVATDVKAIVDAVVEVIAPVLEDVQAQLSKMKEELASCVKKEQMSAKKPIKHNPEVKEETNNTFLYAQSKPKGTINSVFNKLNF